MLVLSSFKLHIVAAEAPSKHLELYGVSWRVARFTRVDGVEGELDFISTRMNQSARGCAAKRSVSMCAAVERTTEAIPSLRCWSLATDD